MKNIEKLRANSLTLVEAKYMADAIERLVNEAKSSKMALSSTARYYRLEFAQQKEISAKRDREAASVRLEYRRILLKIREWEFLTEKSHSDFLKEKRKDT